mmetsp:Transcript_116903/g.308884  ORF Transcript_116903/g.308884 Transcript_116903/m.308884 type:complete len:363 (-) Transcript_116903:1486-2574(-)
MPCRTFAGTSSSTLRLFANGMRTCWTPALWAASTLSRMPPTGSTWPRRLTSPVTAVSLRMGRFSHREARASSTATPAEGPSFGMPPAGKCTWMSSPEKRGPTSPRTSPRPASTRTKRLLRSDRAVSTLSAMTLPSCPVTVSRLAPLLRVASTKSSWPPVADTLRPMATPTISLSAMSSSNISLPMMYGRCCASTVMTPSMGPHADRASSCSWSRSVPAFSGMLTPCSRSAAQRQICASLRSRLRTPLSEVHLAMIPRIAASVTWSLGGSSAAAPSGSHSTAGASLGCAAPSGLRSGAPGGSRACRRRCFGRRCEAVMDIFSSGVYPESSRISMRSSSGRSMSEVSLAVQMNRTLERSNGIFR